MYFVPVFISRIGLSVEMAPAANAPACDGKGESSSNYAQEVELWRRVTNLEPLQMALVLILNMAPVAR